MKFQIAGKTVEILDGDITRQPDLDAVVNAANAQLLPGGGVAGAIHRAAGPRLVEECRDLAPIRPGQAVVTSGCDLPNAHVIHCLGPVYGQDRPEDALLADCYVNALKLADEKALSSIGFPAISTGVFDYPLEEAAQVSVGAVIDALPVLEHIKHVRFVVFGRAAYDVFARALQNRQESIPDEGR